MKFKILIAATVCCFAFSACAAKSETREPAAATEATATAAKEQTAKIVALQPGQQLPTKPAKLTVVDFGAEWCVWCHRFEPVLKAAAAKYVGKVDFVTVDTDVMPEVAQKYNITGLPTQIFIKPDGTVLRNEGYCPAEKFEAIIDSCL